MLSTATVTIRSASGGIVLMVTAPATDELTGLVTRSFALALADALTHVGPHPVKIGVEVRLNV